MPVRDNDANAVVDQGFGVRLWFWTIPDGGRDGPLQEEDGGLPDVLYQISLFNHYLQQPRKLHSTSSYSQSLSYYNMFRINSYAKWGVLVLAINRCGTCPKYRTPHSASFHLRLACELMHDAGGKANFSSPQQLSAVQGRFVFTFIYIYLLLFWVYLCFFTFPTTTPFAIYWTNRPKVRHRASEAETISKTRRAYCLPSSLHDLTVEAIYYQR